MVIQYQLAFPEIMNTSSIIQTNDTCLSSKNRGYEFDGQYMLKGEGGGVPELILIFLQYKYKREGWRDGLAVKNTC